MTDRKAILGLRRLPRVLRWAARKIIYLVGKSDLIELPVALSQRLLRRLQTRNRSFASDRYDC